MSGQTVYEYAIPGRIVLSMPLVRKTLREVQAQLLSRDINGGDKQLRMDIVTKPSRCGMAACLGGWTGLFLLGFDDVDDSSKHLEYAADGLFSRMIELDNAYGSKSGRLHNLFYGYSATADYNEPNVAATAIKRYLAGKTPWPRGDMPNIMPYTKRSRSKR